VTTPATELTDSQLVNHASMRGHVRMRDSSGALVTVELVAWKPRNKNGSRQQRARIRYTHTGSLRTVPAAAVLEVIT
jgi:hypothetical protein